MPRRHIPVGGREHGCSVAEARGHRLGREQLDARGGQCEREGQPVEADADLSAIDLALAAVTSKSAQSREQAT